MTTMSSLAMAAGFEGLLDLFEDVWVLFIVTLCASYLESCVCDWRQSFIVFRVVVAAADEEGRGEEGRGKRPALGFGEFT